MRHQVVLIPGDGIGPEICRAMRRVLDAAGAPIEWEERIAGAAAVERYGTPLPEEVIDRIRERRVALKGPLTTPVGTGHTSANVALRQALDLYACVRPTRTLPGVPSRFGAVDLVIVRENTEGLYSGIEHEVVPGVVESLKIVSERACVRISEFAFQYAVACGRRRVTAVHKANIMKKSDGLFLRCARRVAERYPQIEYDEVIVDACCMRLVMQPERFDVLLTDNLYGDIVSDLAAGLVGGLGVVPGANLGSDCAVFEAVHGSAPDIAGRGIANPIATLWSASMMLDFLGEAAAAAALMAAIEAVTAEGKTLTPDLGGKAGTREVVDAVLGRLNP